MSNAAELTFLLKDLPAYSFNDTIYYWSGIIYKVIKVSHDKLVGVISKYKKEDDKFLTQTYGGIKTFLISRDGFFYVINILLSNKRKKLLIENIKS